MRTFNSLAVNLPLIEGMMGRLEGGSYPGGLVPLSWKTSKPDNLCLVMPLLADMEDVGENPQATVASVRPRTLQRHIETYKDQGSGELPVGEVWAVIEKVGQAIAGMHQHHIPHGNIKPGNIFFDDKGEIKLADFAMGRMPGVSVPPFSDALLYSAPEQLTDPKGYLSGKGYAWDTYAFGLLAFQLLTGKIPLCESTHHRMSPADHERDVSPAQADVMRLSLDHETLKLTGWTKRAEHAQERKRREIIARCLELNPDDRYSDLSEVMHAWHDLETEKEVQDTKKELRQKGKSSRMAVIIALAALIGCGVLAFLYHQEKVEHEYAVTQASSEMVDQIKRTDAQLKSAKSATEDAQAAQKIAEAREQKQREQLISLGVANDHLIAWMMRDHSKELPELKKSGDARETLIVELQRFLELSEGNHQFQPVRARILMQLAELEIHKKNPAKADTLLDAAEAAWNEAKIEEPGHDYRIARARLACLLQAMDQQKYDLAKQFLPKARKAAGAEPSNESVKNQRLKSVMHIIDGRMIQAKDPARALEHFQLAIKDLQGIKRTLTENVIVRSDLAKYTLEAASMADALSRVDDAKRLREEAASYLERLLEQNPNYQLPKIRLANIYIMAASYDIREGDDSAGEKKLSKAEKMLKELPDNDTSPEGANIQMAAAIGLRAVLLRDAGKTSEAKQKLSEAIKLAEEVVAKQKENPSAAQEPLYRLAVLHWQLAGLIGDGGDSVAVLSQGEKAAGLMEELLKKEVGKHDSAIRRGLGYLYGDLGHTAANLGDRKQAAEYFKNAATIWQSLITKYGKETEYKDGLKWSQSRQRDMTGEKK